MKANSKIRLLFGLIIILLVALQSLYGQGEEKLKSMFVEAESYFLFEEYKDALPLYQRLLQADPENFNINYKIGICYLHDIYQVEKSLPYLEKAVKGINSASKTNSFREKQAPPEAFFYLGNAYRANNRLDDAVEAFKQFKSVLDPLVYDAELVDAQIESCHVAADEEAKPMYFISSSLGETINDNFEEMNPVVSGDESVLAFTRKLQFYDAVFCSRKENGKWGAPVNLTPFFSVDGNSYTTGISYDGDELFIYRSDNFDGNLYVSKYKNNNWSKLEKLNSNINTKYWESHASLSKDGKTLYFTSNRAGGYGGLDIYKSTRTRGEDWGPAINLGPVINSKYNEDTPFVTEDGNTLYFSSMGHYNMGGYDIFYSTRLDNGQWAKPINAGYPLNTTNDDLFFTPVGDGSYAYYAKYDQDNTYGLLDIFKLEVFTELHPRKFILNGISRVEGQIKPDFSDLIALLTSTKTGKVIDRTRLNPDGTYTLNAISGDLELQIKGRDIETKTEKFSIPINNPSNIVSHTSLLTAAASEVVPAVVPPVTMAQPPAGPQLVIHTDSFVVTSNQTIPIRMELDRNTNLSIETILNGVLQKTENFEIKRRRFVYMFTPQPGMNLLRLTLTDQQGNSTVKEVKVIYTPAEQAVTVAKPGEKVILADSDRYMGVASLAGDNLARFLNGLNPDQMQFNSIADLYDFLMQHAKDNNFTQAEVDELIARFLSQKDLHYFYDELKSHSSDSLAKTLDHLDLKANHIYTSETLLDYLFSHSTGNIYSLDELREALYQIAASNQDPRSLIELLESFSGGKLLSYLTLMKQNAKSYPSTRAVADNLLKAVTNNEFPVSELESALSKAAADLELHFLYQSLLFISGDSLRQTLLDLELRKAGIVNSFQLITYLMGQSEPRGYSKRELMNNIEKIRKDPYYYVDLFRKLLAEKATGSLKIFLQEIDIRGLKINTFEELVDYLLNQSKFHDFNREMVYQLLLDIIDLKNVKDFVDVFLRYCDERLANAIHATDVTQFSKPLEVLQYLLSVADDYNYSERDLLRVLLKMLLRKGSEGLTAEAKEGWFSSFDKPALVTTLIIVNSIIIILLIVFLLRKKRKNEENGNMG
jgi:tetratricopeptide (TPR) repeat protein